MLIAFDPNEIREYSLKGDVGEEKTVFELGYLDAPLRAVVDDRTTSFGMNTKGLDEPADVRVNNKQRNIDLVRYGLRGWRNLKDKKGTDIAFDRVNEAVPKVGNRAVVSDACLRRLRPEWIDELAQAIIDENYLSEEERKN